MTLWSATLTFPPMGGWVCGINLGDVIVEAGDVFGDGVNIAARLESIAEAGSVYLSDVVHGQVAGKVDYDFDDLGPQSLKNISNPVRVFRLRATAIAEDAAQRSEDVPGPAPFDSSRAIAVLQGDLKRLQPVGLPE